uniref:Uncharacterized protein n=1 Tax=Populus alba TaxID=43335 RepID=A0A4U5MW69_POPAL|nr:hypothetical protein D5086_0000297040 [Populus alba]
MVVLWRFFFSVLCFSSASFFLLLPVLFLLPLSGCSYVSVVVDVVDDAVGGGGVRMWLQMVVPGLLSMTGRKAAVGSGSRVALVVAMRIATGGSSSFLSFFVFTSKTWQWY